MATDFLEAFGGKLLTSAEFVQLFKKYDEDGNGKIEAGELDNLLKDLLVATRRDGNEDPPSPDEVQAMKEKVLQNYDDNYDGCLNMNELSHILPTEDNFLNKFQELSCVTSVQFMQIYMHYDKDRSGFLEEDELEGFIRELFSTKDDSVVTSPTLIEDYKRHIIDLYDKNKDNKIGLSELSGLIPTEENFLNKFSAPEISDEDFNQLFSHYDADNSGEIESEEILAFLKDILEMRGKKEYEMEDLQKFKESIMACCDTNQDGKLSKEELMMFVKHTK